MGYRDALGEAGHEVEGKVAHVDLTAEGHAQALVEGYRLLFKGIDFCLRVSTSV
jgi:hypothetical protein